LTFHLPYDLGRRILDLEQELAELPCLGSSSDSRSSFSYESCDSEEEGTPEIIFFSSSSSSDSSEERRDLMSGQSADSYDKFDTRNQDLRA